MVDEFPVNFQDAVGQVRKYIPDLVQLPDPGDPDGTKSFIFSDDEIKSFVFDESPTPETPRGWEIKRAAANAMIALANSENLILKKIVTQDQQTDGPSVAKQLIAAAAALYARADRDQKAADDLQGIGTENLFAIFPPQTHETSYRAYRRGWF